MIAIKKAPAASRRSGPWCAARALLLLALLVAGSVHPLPRTAAAQRPPPGGDWGTGPDASLSEDGEALLRQLLLIYRRLGDRWNEGGALHGLGRVTERLGRYAEALEFYEQTLAIARELRSPFNQAVALNNLGSVHTELGRPAQALAAHGEALALARQIGERELEAGQMHNIARVYLSQGDPARALELFEESLALTREVRSPFRQGQMLDDVGAALYQLGDYARALDAYQEALPLVRGGNAGRDEAVVLAGLGFVHEALGQPDQARARHEEALAIARLVGDRGQTARALEGIGRADEAQGDLTTALGHYRQAIAVREEVRAAARLDELKTGLAAQAAGLYERAVLLSLRLGQPAEAFELAERARARGFLDQLGNTRLDLGRRAGAGAGREQALRAEIDGLDRQLRADQAQPVPQQDAARVETLRQQLATRQREYADLLTQLRLVDPESASLMSVAPLGLSDVQPLLAPDTTLLSYYVTPTRALAFLLTRHDFQTVELPVAESDLQAAVAEFRAFADPGDPRPDSLRKLADWLVAPLADQLRTPAVAIVPHGVLHYLPFAALPTADGYLGDRHALHYLPSASTLPFIQAKRKGSADRVLALARSQAEGLPPLRFADLEAQAIARLFGAEPLTGAAATRSALVAQAGQYPILHLAAHGELNQASPLFSRLFLGPDADGDGTLTVQEVYGLDLARADLVVLSACDTQLGPRSRGDDLVSLNRAFIYAGAPTVVASLWSVNDPATAVLMTAFYRHLRAGQSKAAALQAAQADTRAQYPHPYYWAGFVLTGDPGAPSSPSER